MSASRFVSAGNVDQPSDKDDAWKKAQAAVEATKKEKEEAASGSGLQEGGKTLYEVLQANKAAKQEAFEESLRLKNQVQFLNEEDEEYLESLSKNERAQRAASAKEAREQLNAFRKQQEEVEKQVLAGGQAGTSQEEAETWSISARKRKKGKEQDFIKGVKLRKTSSTDQVEAEVATAEVGGGVNVAKEAEFSIIEDRKALSPARAESRKSLVKAHSPTAGLGLGAYSSDEDD